MGDTVKNDTILTNNEGIIPSEKVWVKYAVDDKIKYIITSDKSRNIYYLYKYNAKECKYIKTAHQSNDPTKLESKYVKLNSTQTTEKHSKTAQATAQNNVSKTPKKKGKLF
jgi:hypothetical protein